MIMIYMQEVERKTKYNKIQKKKKKKKKKVVERERKKKEEWK